MRHHVKRLAALLLASLVATGSLAQQTRPLKELKGEALGPTYPIAEPDMLQSIEKRLRGMERSGQLQDLITQGTERATRSAQYPAPVQGLGKATVNRTYYFNPSIRVNRDIRDAEGRVIVKAGTTVNPFDYASMNTWLLFFDGTDKRQVQLAEKLGREYGWQIKPILTAGGPLDLGRVWKRRVYFDQGGFLVKRLGIQNVPALVTQEGKEMRIDELRY